LPSAADGRVGRRRHLRLTANDEPGGVLVESIM
jgi:hypothetical protein